MLGGGCSNGEIEKKSYILTRISTHTPNRNLENLGYPNFFTTAPKWVLDKMLRNR